MMDRFSIPGKGVFAAVRPTGYWLEVHVAGRCLLLDVTAVAARRRPPKAMPLERAERAAMNRWRELLFRPPCLRETGAWLRENGIPDSGLSNTDAQVDALVLGWWTPVGRAPFAWARRNRVPGCADGMRKGWERLSHGAGYWIEFWNIPGTELPSVLKIMSDCGLAYGWDGEGVCCDLVHYQDAWPHREQELDLLDHAFAAWSNEWCERWSNEVHENVPPERAYARYDWNAEFQHALCLAAHLKALLMEEGVGDATTIYVERHEQDPLLEKEDPFRIILPVA